MGLWTSETALGFYGGVGAILVTLVALLWLPAWTRIDETGVERRRGLVPWLAFRRPPEDFERVELVRVMGYPGRSTVRQLLALAVELVMRRAGRLGTLAPRKSLALRLHMARTRGARDEAASFAAAVARALSVPVRESERGASSGEPRA
jgi:hypothetical protein